MAMPVSTVSAADAFEAMRAQARQIRGLVLRLVEQFNAGSVYPDYLLQVLATGQETIAVAMSLRSTPGLATYAGASLGDPSADFTALLNTTLTALAALAGAILAEFPHDPATGLLQHARFDGTGAVVKDVIPASALPNTAAAMTAFLATIS